MLSTWFCLTVTTKAAASTAACYALRNLTIGTGGATFNPTVPSQTMSAVSTSVTLQINAAAGSVNGGVTVDAGNRSQISGGLYISPPVDVAVVVTLYGMDQEQLGQYTAHPGSGGGTFNLPASPGQGMPETMAMSQLFDLLGVDFIG